MEYAGYFNKKSAHIACFCLLMMVILQIAIIALRNLYDIGFVWLQELMMYLYALTALSALGLALQTDSHVRVDIFYRPLPVKYKALIDLLGSLFLLVPLCLALIWTSLPFVIQSWSVMEASPQTSGLPGIFLLKSLIPLSAGLLAFQALGNALVSLKLLSTPKPASRSAADIAEQNQEKSHVA